jgi:hypothetical protein
MNCQTIQTIQKIAKDQAIVKSARDDPPRAAQNKKNSRKAVPFKMYKNDV